MGRLAPQYTHKEHVKSLYGSPEVSYWLFSVLEFTLAGVSPLGPLEYFIETYRRMLGQKGWVENHCFSWNDWICIVLLVALYRTTVNPKNHWEPLFVLTQLKHFSRFGGLTSGLNNTKKGNLNTKLWKNINNPTQWQSQSFYKTSNVLDFLS